MRVLLSFLAALLLSACATTGDRASLEPRDPYEGFNRNVWAFNDAVDTAAIKPAATVYRTITPVPARRGLSRVFANLTEPFSAINALLQGKPGRAVNSLGRFLINTTIGVGGLADHATDLGLRATREDFGQTLATWGVKESPYLVLPLLGPSTVRDGVGTVVQVAADPAGLILKEVGLNGTERAGVTGMRIIDQRAQAMENGTDSLLRTSVDPYAAARSAFFQRRDAQLRDDDNSGRVTTGPEGDQEALDKALDEEAAPAPEPEEPPTAPQE